MNRDEPVQPIVSCPPAEQLAAYIDGTLSAQDRQLLESHFSECEDCRTVLVETTQFRAADTIHSGVKPRLMPRPSVQTSRLVAIGLAAAAVVILAVGVWWLKRPSGLQRDDGLGELATALAEEPTRPVEGMLSAGFAYKPPPVEMRGSSRAPSPDVRIAAAKIEKIATADRSPAHLGDLGVAALAAGDYDGAVRSLAEAAEAQPKTSRFLIDLSAAYLARARVQDRSEDWVQALAAAERAAAISPDALGASFNRALALEGLHLNDRAERAWSEYLQRDPQSAWAAEARNRLDIVRKRRQSSSQQSRENLDLQTKRERVEDVLLPAWASAHLAGDQAKAKAILEDVEKTAAAIVVARGDSMALDEVKAIERARRNATAARCYAIGHLYFGRARQQYLLDRLEEASRLMAVAERQFAVVASPYRYWGPVFRATAQRASGHASAAIRQLAVLPVDTLPASYYHLRGRVAWMRGASFAHLGRFDLARRDHSSATTLFERAHETENLTANLAHLAEAEWELGNRREAWSHEIEALSMLGYLRASTRRNVVLFDGAYFSLGQNLPEAALHFQTALVDALQGAHENFFLPEALRYRARIFDRLGRRNRALSDIAQATRAANETSDEGLRSRSLAEINAVRAELQLASNPRQTRIDSTKAIEYFERARQTTRLPDLLALRARAANTLNDPNGAESDLSSAVRVFEQNRNELTLVGERLDASAGQRAVFRELVGFEVKRGRYDDALRAAERGRAGSLRKPGEWASIDPDQARRALPANGAALYFVVLTDRLVTWVLTRDANHHFDVPLTSAGLSAAIDRMQRAIDAGADLAAVNSPVTAFSNSVIQPALRAAGNSSLVVLFPDGPLWRIPFPAILGDRGQPLVATRSIVVAYNFSEFISSSAHLSSFEPDDILAIGDGHDPSRTGLRRLSAADNEARVVAALYSRATLLVGPEATRRGLMTSTRRVFHFAGHTVMNSEHPMLSRLFLAPDSDNDDGSVLASEIVAHDFRRTSVVVLATCESGGGSFIEGEGVVNMASAFLAAGVGSVIGSLWPVEDQSTSTLVELHRALRINHDPSAALRQAQMDFLKAEGRRAPVKTWAGFAAFGGARLE